MMKLPAFSREILTRRRFGNWRPKFDAVFVMDDWNFARASRERLSYCTLVIEPFIRYDFSCCADLDVILVMRGDAALALKALGRAGARSVNVCTIDLYLDWLEWVAERRCGRPAELAA